MWSNGPYSTLCPTLDGDVLVVLARTRHPLTGNHAGIAEVAEEALPHLRRAQPAIVRTVRADVLVLHGRDVTDVLGAGR
jgi:hypothetical protein